VELVKTLHQNEEIIKRCLENYKRVFLLMGGAFSAIKENNLWQTTDAASFNEYIEKYWGFKHAQIDNYIRVTKEFGPLIESNPEFQGIKMTRLVEILPHITPSNKMELLHSSSQIPGTKAWECYIRDLKGQTPADSCIHPDGFNPIGIEVCPICNLKRKVNK
jgi:hypothetical protein